VAYRGRDRRSVPVDSALPVARICLAVGVLALVLGVAITALRDLHTPAPTFALPLIRLDVGASLLASITAAACFLRWRLEGTASAFWSGLTILVLGLSGFVSTDLSRGYTAAGLACSVVAIGLIAVWLRGLEIDTKLSVPRVATITIGFLVLAFFCARVLVENELAGAVLSLSIGVALVVCAYGAYRMHPRDQWLIVVLAAYALAHLEYAPLAVTDPLRNAAATTLHLIAMGIAAFAATLLLHEAASRQREVAFRLLVERDEAQERFADTLHEVRSTVTALEGGVSTFAPGTDPAQAVLSRALVAEIRRLRALVEDRESSPEAETFWLRDALEPILTVCVAAGQVVSWDIPADVHAVGRSDDIAQVVHALLTNARRHAEHSPVDVMVERADGFALIRVEDRGPGVCSSQRQTIFERGERGNARAGSEGLGLGLHIARTIARAQGGDLWVDARLDGGASFALTVPTVTVLPSARRDGDLIEASVWSHPLATDPLRRAQ
jgi:signal transduction histidine kinase